MSRRNDEDLAPLRLAIVPQFHGQLGGYRSSFIVKCSVLLEIERRSTPGKIPYDEPQIRGTFRKPAHEPWIPEISVSDEHSAPPSAVCQVLLLAGLNTEKHLHFDVDSWQFSRCRKIRNSLINCESCVANATLRMPPFFCSRSMVGPAQNNLCQPRAFLAWQRSLVRHTRLSPGESKVSSATVIPRRPSFGASTLAGRYPCSENREAVCDKSPASR